MRRCADGELCIGSLCETRSGPGQLAPDGRTVWRPEGDAAGYYALQCPLCRCAPRAWPVAQCSTVDLPYSGLGLDSGYAGSGWGNTVNSMLMQAPGAMAAGRGFMMSSAVCAYEARRHGYDTLAE